MATAADTGFFRPLTENPFLRLATVVVFYIFEGIPMGLFYTAVPAYMASQGAGTTEIATVVSAFSLPWTLKLVNGFLMDRWTFLPMGRRRIWIICSQATMALTLLYAAFAAPSGSDVFLLSVIAFVVSMATTFQDVAIDSLVVDIMTEEEQAKAGGFMFGSQAAGIALATVAGGYLLQHFGTGVTFMVAAVFLMFGVAFAITLRERPGERRLPWSAGTSHQRNLDIKIDASWPLLKQSFKAMMAPASVIIVPFLLVRNIPAGIYDVFDPVLATQYVGLTTSQYTNITFFSASVSGAVGFFLGGWLTAKIGKLRVLTTMYLLTSILVLGAGAAVNYWTDPVVLYALVWGIDMFSIFVAIAMIPVAMQICTPAVAATQFTIYMALANFGRPIGAWIVATTSAIDPQLIFFTIGPIMLVAAIGTRFLKESQPTPELERATHHGVGAGPVDN
ncbi:MFS transporter [Altererythrobacter salegens]|uniref:MFS transporter n=1 Tax=Croceibacterium salegens TaxID=1737568 RepID=A0A6I4SVC5_9SPHN|nr:MFS transporter [Croceibacterium salegens]MXO58746.1 MFS transporter [Croceibacterium salegens]